MFRYAQLSRDNAVIGISQLNGEVVDDNLILINDLEVELGSSYNRETDEFIPPEPQTEIEPQPSIEEEILIETRYQTMLLEMTNLGGM